MTKLAKTFSAPRYNTLIGIVLACVMGVLTYFGLFYQQKLLLKIIQFKALMSLTIKKILTGKISPQKFQFVYLKATEGGDYKDPKFQENWLKAREHGFHVGAYHFIVYVVMVKHKLKILLQLYPTKLMPFLLLLIWNMTAAVLIPIPKNNYLKK